MTVAAENQTGSGSELAVASSTTDATPDAAGGNPFEMIAYLLFAVRHSLEDTDPERAPRWVRIARARDVQGGVASLIDGVKTGVDIFTNALSYLVKLTLDVQDVLIQTDAVKALAEVSLDLIGAATTDEFKQGINELTGLSVDTTFDQAAVVLEIAKKGIDYIPDPDDLDGISHELYRLLCIEQHPLPKNAAYDVEPERIPPTTESHIGVEGSGKARLLQWAFGQSLSTYGKGEGSIGLSRFGSRRLWQPGTEDYLPNSSIGRWGKEGEEETVFEFYFDSRELVEIQRTKDIAETIDILESLGYTPPDGIDKTVFSPGLLEMIRRFQAVNELPITGELDNETINRLLNLDYRSKNLKRALPFDSNVQIPGDLPNTSSGYFELVNPDADHPEAEDIEIKNEPLGYRYYIAGSGQSTKGGWIRATANDVDQVIVDGFVAMFSRAILEGKNGHWFHGQRLSEGESASGAYFFCARHTEPWIAGRHGPPGGDALFPNSTLSIRTISRMYQWVPLDQVKKLATDQTDKFEIHITASVQMRALYTSRSGQTDLPDQGRICIEFYDAEDFTEGLMTQRPLSPASFSRHESDWFPEHAAPKAKDPNDWTPLEIARKRKWTLQTISAEVPANAVAMLVMLEGLWMIGSDIDAYFDDVMVHWKIRKQGTSGQ